MSAQRLCHRAEAGREPILRLAVETGIRVDLPADQRQQLLRSATEAVRDAAAVARAAASCSKRSATRSPRLPPARSREMSRSARFHRRPPLRRAARQARQAHRGRSCWLLRGSSKYAETVAALAELSGSSRRRDPPLSESLRDDGVLIPCRVAGPELGDRRRRARRPLRLGTHGPARRCGERAIRQADTGKRRRLLRFWQGPRDAPDAEIRRAEMVNGGVFRRGLLLPSPLAGEGAGQAVADEGLSSAVLPVDATLIRRFAPPSPTGEKEEAITPPWSARVEMLQPRHHLAA